MSRRALITGITGQDGSYLAEHLHADGWEIHGLTRSATASEETEVPVWATRHMGDLADREGLTRVIDAADPDVVFHLAGVTSVARSWEDPVGTADLTGISTAAILDAAWKRGKDGRPTRVIVASSAEIFGAASAPQSERTPIAPTSPYGAAKAFAHHLVGVYRARGLDAGAAIFFNHESPRRPSTFVTRKITRGAARIAAGLDTRLRLGNLDARRDWGWAPDYVDALVKMSEVEADDFVIATGIDHSVEDFVATAFECVDLDWRDHVLIDTALLRPVDATIQRGDASRARHHLGWRPTVTFREMVAAMVAHDLAEIRR